MKKIINKMKFAIVFALVVGLIFAVKASNASTPTGVATLSLSPGTSSVAPNTATTITVIANTSTRTVDGMNFAIDFTGSVPSTITFNFASVPGLTLDFNSTQNITGGKRLMVALGSATGYTSSNTNVTLGTITFTSPASGTLNANFDKTFSNFAETATFADILRDPTNAVYTITVNPTPTPTPSASPSTFPTATPKASPTPSPDTANISLSVKFQGVDSVRSGPDRLVQLWLKRVSDGVVLSDLAVSVSNTSSNDGTYSNTSPLSFSNFQNGQYEVFVKGPIHLTKAFGAQQLTAGASNSLNFTDELKTSDSNGDNTVDQTDYNQFISSFRCKQGVTPWPTGKNCASFAADADLNGDININDYPYLVTNYTLSGATHP